MMFRAYLTVFIVALVQSTKAAGVGKAWQVSPVQNPDHPAVLSPLPRMETSPFEVRSISGVGHLALYDSHQEPFDSERSIGKANETSISFKDLQKEPITETKSRFRQSRELENLGNSLIPECIFYDLMVEGFFRKTKKVKNVEALSNSLKKFRSHGRTGRNHGHCSEVEEIDESYTDDESDSEHLESNQRIRRETRTDMDKIAASKNVRKTRLRSPESWSKQPLSVEFRQQTNLEKVTDEDNKLTRSTARGLQAPQAEFVTANRRSFSHSRESRDLPLAASRSFDEMPTYRNTLRDHNLDAPYSRGYFYPERYRTERDYFVGGSNQPTYPQERYREVDFDLYGRSRPLMPKPKRIIYYATLPEVIRKPVDLRSYNRPYDMMTRFSTNVMPQDGLYEKRGASMDPERYRYYSYPFGSNYNNYDMYPKISSWNDRPYAPYSERIEDTRRREQAMDHANIMDAPRNEEALLEMDHDRKMGDHVKSRDSEKMPWPVKIGMEVSFKENERISGRNVFEQRNDYNRLHNKARMDRDREGTEPAENRD